MSDSPVQPQGSKTSLLDNPAQYMDEFISKRDAGSGTEQGNSNPAEPTAAVAPETAQPSWRDVTIGDDVDHGFFKGKKVADLVESYKHAERAKQEAERQRNEAIRQVEAERARINAELAAHKVYAEQQRKASHAEADPLVEAEKLIFENPRESMRIVMEQALAGARQIAAQEAARVKQETEAKWQSDRIATTGEQAFHAARHALGVDEATWNKRGIALLSTVTNKNTEYFQKGGPLNVNVLMDAYQDLFGPVQAQPVPPAPVTAPNPPGAKKPAAPVAPSANPSQALDREKAQAIDVLAGALTNGTRMQIDPEKLKKRYMEARRG